MKCNIGKKERIFRVVIGCALMIGGFALSGTAGMIMAGFGLIPLGTGLVGNCPAYTIFKINTCKTQRFN
jgi:Inner membrane protein YgaP-like, transmembrane domain